MHICHEECRSKVSRIITLCIYVANGNILIKMVFQTWRGALDIELHTEPDCLLAPFAIFSPFVSLHMDSTWS